MKYLKALTKNRVVTIIHRAVADWIEDGALSMSAALAYYSVFSIAPLIIIAIYIAGVFFGPEAVRGQLDEQIRSYVGSKAAEAVQTLVQSAYRPAQGWLAATMGILALIFGASGVFGQLKDALNTIWEVQPKYTNLVVGFLRDRLLNFAMVLVIGFLLLTSLLLSAAIAALNSYLERALGVPAYVWSFANLFISFGIVTTLFAFIFKVLPDVNIAWRHVWLGALVTSGLFEIGKFGLALYLGRESTSSSYGAAGSVVLLLLWVYYTSCILLFGAEFTRAYTKVMAERIKPSPGAVPITAEARAQHGLEPVRKQDQPLPPDPEDTPEERALSASSEGSPLARVPARTQILPAAPPASTRPGMATGAPAPGLNGHRSMPAMSTVVLITAAGILAGAALSAATGRLRSK